MQQHQVQVIPNQLIMDYKMNKENELIKSLIQNKLKSNAISKLGNVFGLSTNSNPLVKLGSMILTGKNRKQAKAMGEQTLQEANYQNELAKNRLNQINNIMQFSPTAQNQNNSVETTPQISQENYDNLINKYMEAKQVKTNNQISNDSQEINERKNKIFSNMANGFNDFLTGYNENKNEGFSPENWQDNTKKGIVQKIGEGVGTISRMAQNPNVQGIAIGGLASALTGNPLYGLGLGYKFANQKMNSDTYKDVLNQQGISTNNNGVLTSDDFIRILSSQKDRKDYISRGDFDKLRLDNGMITLDEYNANINNPNYNPNELVNIPAFKSVTKASRTIQENKNDRSKNYYRSKNDGKNVIKVEYDKKPDSHSYTHVTYGQKPKSENTVYVKYDNKPKQNNTQAQKINNDSKTIKTKSKTNNKNKTRVKVISPDGKKGSIPAKQLLDALKRGFKKYRED